MTCSGEQTSQTATKESEGLLNWAHPFPRLLLALPQFLIPCLNERRYSEICDETTNHVLYRYSSGRNVKGLEREAITHPMKVTVKLDMVTAVEKGRVDFRGNVLETDFGFISYRGSTLDTVGILKGTKGVPSSFWNGL